MRFQIKQWIKMFCQHVLFPATYFLNRFKKIDEKLVILADAHHDICPPNLIEIKKELENCDLRVEYFFLDVGRASSKKGMQFMLRFMRRYPVAKSVIICDNFLPVASCRKRKGTKVIQTWHGCGAFKKFGYDAKDDIPQGYKGNVYKNYDLVTVSGEAAVKPFAKAMGYLDSGSNVVKAFGVAHTDRLFDDEYRKTCLDRFHYQHPNAYGKKIVLYAPSFRGNAANAELVGEEMIDRLAQNTDFYVVKSLHPHLLMARNETLATDQLTTDELLVCADCLITDYSSVFFEYLLMDKPIVFFAPDYNEYFQERGFYLEYNALPGHKVLEETSEQELQHIIEEAVKEDSYKEARHGFVEKYMGACNGQVTKRLIEFVKEGQK